MPACQQGGAVCGRDFAALFEMSSGVCPFHVDFIPVAFVSSILPLNIIRPHISKPPTRYSYEIGSPSSPASKFGCCACQREVSINRNYLRELGGSWTVSVRHNPSYSINKATHHSCPGSTTAVPAARQSRRTARVFTPPSPFPAAMLPGPTFRQNNARRCQRCM